MGIPIVVIEIKGGLIQNIVSNEPVLVISHDYDTNDSGDIDELTEIPARDCLAYIVEHDANVDPKEVERLTASLDL